MNENNYVMTIRGTKDIEELNRTLTALFGTRASSLPGDRDYGISWECLDEPPEVAESILAMEIIKKVEKYEPRVSVEDITLKNVEGKTKAFIQIVGKEGNV